MLQTVQNPVFRVSAAYGNSDVATLAFGRGREGTSYEGNPAAVMRAAGCRIGNNQAAECCVA